MRILFVIILMMLTLSGCGTMYAPPVSGPTAKLRVVTLNSNFYYTWNRDASITCSRDSPNFQMLGGDSNAKNSAAGFSDQVEIKNDSFESVIKAETPLRLWQNTMRAMSVGEAILSQTNVISYAYTKSMMWNCNVVTEFTPNVGKNYELISDFAPGRCKITVNEVDVASDGKVIKTAIPALVMGGPEQPDVCDKLSKK